MARKKKEDVAPISNGPDFEGAANLIRTEISPDKEDLSKIQGDLSASWKRVEDAFGVNKKAAKDVAKLLSMSDETRDDYLRSFFGMMVAFNIAVTADLVDQAEGGNVITMPTKPRATGSELEA